jgi:Protein kinase domain
MDSRQEPGQLLSVAATQCDSTDGAQAPQVEPTEVAPADSSELLTIGVINPGSAAAGRTFTVGASGPGFVADPLAGLPAHIGRYRVRSLLGEGGFGTVYLVYDEQLERQVAVKVPHHQLVADPEAVQFCLAEARAAARLDHPSIVPVYDAGSSPDCPCFTSSVDTPGA